MYPTRRLTLSDTRATVNMCTDTCVAVGTGRSGSKVLLFGSDEEYPSVKNPVSKSVTTVDTGC